MAPRERGYLLFRLLANERGVLFPVAIVLLFVVTGACLLYVNAYQSQIKVYNSLESVNVRATINVLEKIDR